jgi:predicted secreted protein
MFTDARSKCVILVAHCLLNQNAKLDRCAFYPGAIREAAQTILDAGVGMLQMPCPETLCLGLDRGMDRTARPSVGDEDTRIAAAMQARENTDWMQTEAEEIVTQVEEYLKNGFAVLGVVGINGSPTCAVERTWYEDAEQIGPGVFIAILQETLAQRGIRLPMRGIRATEPETAVETVKALLSGGD